MCMPKTVKFYSVFPQNECEKVYVSVIKNCLKLDALTIFLIVCYMYLTSTHAKKREIHSM